MAESNGEPPVLGIDLGGTKILAGVVTSDHRILGRAKRSTPAKEGGEAILRAMADAVEEAVASAGLKTSDIAAAGVGSPGPLDAERGVILFSANMAVKDFALGPDLSKILRQPVLVQNDVRAGGYGEYRLGAGRGFQNMVAAFVGTGIGGCVIVDGKIVNGLTGNAGEIGHICIKSKGPLCGCGRRGCMEALASRTAIARRIGKAIKAGTRTVMSGILSSRPEKLKSRELASAYTSGDPVTVHEIHRAAHYLGIGLGSIMNVLCPELVVVGGGVAEALGRPYLDVILASAREQALADPEGRIKIELASLGDDAVMLGASLMAREKHVAAVG